MTAPLTLEAALNRGRHNNLDLLRLIAAMAVVVSHAWPLALGRGATEPLQGALGISLGGVAVLLFFFLSGMLVTASAERNRISKGRFVMARVMRIFPGLSVALVVTVLLALASGATANLSEAVIYILRGLSLVSLQHELSDAFAANPYAGAVNGPLWTLFYEVGCYALIAAAVWCGLLRQAFGWSIVVATALGLWVVFELTGWHGGSSIVYRLSVMAPVLLAFITGAVFWKLRIHLVLRWWAGILFVSVAAIFAGHALFLPIFTIALGYTACLLAFRLPVFSLKGDISYGVYVYGWPVAQAVVALLAPSSPITLAVLSCLAVLPFAIASWIWVEKPALSLLRRARLAGTSPRLAVQ